MNSPYFVKFPRTHWLPIGEKPCKAERYLGREEVQALFASEVQVSEKLDGANVGISFQEGKLVLQKRGGFIGKREHPQYGAFKEWAFSRYDRFSGLLKDQVLFGEWLYARHSIHYTHLPDYFFLFDVWQEERFLSVRERDSLAIRLGLWVPPVVFQGRLSLEGIADLVAQSSYSDECMEGVVVRNGNIRGKYVRSDFIQGEHWSARQLVKNKLKVKGMIEIYVAEGSSWTGLGLGRQ